MPTATPRSARRDRRRGARPANGEADRALLICGTGLGVADRGEQGGRHPRRHRARLVLPSNAESSPTTRRSSRWASASSASNSPAAPGARMADVPLRPELGIRGRRWPVIGEYESTRQLLMSGVAVGVSLKTYFGTSGARVVRRRRRTRRRPPGGRVRRGAAVRDPDLPCRSPPPWTPSPAPPSSSARSDVSKFAPGAYTPARSPRPSSPRSASRSPRSARRAAAPVRRDRHRHRGQSAAALCTRHHARAVHRRVRTARGRCRGARERGAAHRRSRRRARGSRHRRVRAPSGRSARTRPPPMSTSSPSPGPCGERSTPTPARAGSIVIYGGSAGPGLLTRLGDAVDGLFLGRFAHRVDALVASSTRPPRSPPPPRDCNGHAETEGIPQVSARRCSFRGPSGREGGAA